MTGREKIAAAFSPEGAPEFPAVVCYPSIFERDHFADLTDLPWTYQHETDPEKQARLAEGLNAGADLDWFCMPLGYPREVQERVRIIEDAQGAFRVDTRTGERERLSPPVVSGTLRTSRDEAPSFDDLESFLAERVQPGAPFSGLPSGCEILPQRLAASLGRRKCPIMQLSSPLWGIGSILGYEQWFLYLATDPDPVFRACERLLGAVIQQVKLAAASGCEVIWIEDCMTDQIGPERFARLNLPLLRALTDAIRGEGMFSVYYYCGDPWPMWDWILDSGADALSLEESKKGFAIDIAEVVARVRGRMTVLGNLDAYEILELADGEALRAEIARQLAAGGRNGRRFIMSTGSPVTPGTPVRRVRDYVQIVRELGTG